MFKHLTIGNLLAGIAITGIVAGLILPKSGCGFGQTYIIFFNSMDKTYTFYIIEEDTEQVLLSTDVLSGMYVFLDKEQEELINWDTYPEGLKCVAEPVGDESGLQIEIEYGDLNNRFYRLSDEVDIAR